MRIISSLGLAVFMLAASTVSSSAWQKVGRVWCDANSNSKIDVSDVPVQGVLVVVENSSGSFSNAAWTTAEGYFSIPLPDVPDEYVDYIHPDTLPVGTTSVYPAMDTFYTSAKKTTVTNCFLIKNPECEEKACWLTGGGTIRNVRGRPLFTFGGNVNPGCSPTAGQGGNWNVIAHALNLHFRGTAIEVIDCGNVQGFPPGSTSPVTPFNFIDFRGTGILTGVGANRIIPQRVSFVARALDIGEPGGGIDRLYLRVVNGQGRTVILISGTPASPTTVSPIPISTGNLQLHISSCDNPPF